MALVQGQAIAKLKVGYETGFLWGYYKPNFLAVFGNVIGNSRVE